MSISANIPCRSSRRSARALQLSAAKRILPLRAIKRSLSVDFEPMHTEQMKALFGAILSGTDVSIKYIDPKNGEETRTFSQPTLPAASYEEMETTQGTWLQFWTIPTITFEEKSAESASDDSG